MAWLHSLFDSGRVADIAIVVLLVQTVVLVRIRPDLRPSLIANACAGLALIGALRAALVGAGPLWIGGCLVAGFIAYQADLRLRMRKPASFRSR